MDLYFLKFNNYYNRIVKKFDTLSEYLVSPYYNNQKLINCINFNPNDGVNTEQVVNSQYNCDYVLVTSNNQIVSRWFVTENIRLRGGQSRLILRRDLVADNYQSIIDAPAFIEKATVKPSDSAIFNKENMTFNQIKKSETLLKDETGSAWVVGFIPKNAVFEQPINTKYSVQGTAQITVDKLSDWHRWICVESNPEYQPVKGNLQANNCVYAGYVAAMGQGYTYMQGFGITGDDKIVQANDNIGNPRGAVPGIISPDFTNQTLKFSPASGFGRTEAHLIIDNAPKNWSGDLCSLFASSYWNIAIDDVDKDDGKIIYESSTGLYYKIKVNKVEMHDVITLNSTNSGRLYDYLYTDLNRQLGVIAGTSYSITGDSAIFKALLVYTQFSIELSQVEASGTATITEDRYHLEDQPFDMFCIPYSDDLKIYKNNTQILTSNKSLAVNMANQIGLSTGTGNIYDIQLLPYCPVRYCIKGDKFDIGDSKVTYITNSNNENVGVILWATNSSFTFDINININIDDYKISNECDLWRLVSPNYNGQFEFNAAKNGGVNGFNVDCTYKPFNSWIHANPNFNRLYGEDFNDSRGLICGGDFSLPQTSNAWANYEQQNKNYLNIFNREIENLEISNKYSNINQLVGGVTSAFSTGVAASTFFGPVGGVASGLVSAVGGAVDYAFAKNLQNEAMDYKKDMFGYQLGNIKAMPNSLAKTSAININNKLFIVLEYYSCTEEEKQALRDKIKYNGMTVGRIGKIRDFLTTELTYIKAQLIRLEISEDTTYLNEIANEINKGVFIN